VLKKSHRGLVLRLEAMSASIGDALLLPLIALRLHDGTVLRHVGRENRFGQTATEDESWYLLSDQRMTLLVSNVKT
jgi:hypothetical protein